MCGKYVITGKRRGSAPHKANMLHCGLKPDNVRWNNDTTKLIDFEMAQPIVNTTWNPRQLGYMVPEVLKKQPCSIQTDAYAVGMTILAKLERL